MKKIIPALCMLLISAMLMGTSTYAWFSMNNTVTAQGMKVQAVTSGGLFINNATSLPNYLDVNTASVDFNTKTVELKPTSSKDLASWWSASAAQASSYEKDTQNFVDISTTAKTAVKDASDNTTNALSNGYYLVSTVYLRSEKDFKKLQLNNVSFGAAHTGTSSNAGVLENALTVGIKVTAWTNTTGTSTPITSNNVVLISAEQPTNESDSTLNKRHGAITGATSIDSTVEFKYNVNTSNVVDVWTDTADNDLANAVITVEIYVYYDGQSASCYSNALVEAIKCTGDISVSFQTAEA